MLRNKGLNIPILLIRDIQAMLRNKGLNIPILF